jgi:hypothetical protein
MKEMNENVKGSVEFGRKCGMNKELIYTVLKVQYVVVQ